MSFARAGSTPVSGTNNIMEGKSFSFLLKGSFDEVEEELMKELNLARETLENIDLIFLFVTSDWKDHLDDVAEIIKIGAHSPVLVGGSADCLITKNHEEENSSGCSILGVKLPSKAKVSTFEISDWSDDMPEALADPGGWIVLGNPFMIDGNKWAEKWNHKNQNIPTYGGLVSGGRDVESVFLINSEGVSKTAGLAIGFEGIDFGGVVSQGCRPIGNSYAITDAESNIIHGIGSQPAFEMLEEAYNSLVPDEKKVAQGNILVGLAMSEYKDDFGCGDFLIRGILGGDKEAGAIAVAAHPKVGQTIQFQLRDGESAREDLNQLLETESEKNDIKPFAGLLFSCTGRGEHLFGSESHDARAVDQHFKNLDIGGFFCNGEIGPIGGKVYLHGFTASIVTFIERNN